MSLLSDLKVLYHLAVKPVRGGSHAERMESFYAGQADAYDDFRRRLLKGREEMYGAVPTPDGGVWVDMGGGTGSNLEYLSSHYSTSRPNESRTMVGRMCILARPTQPSSSLMSPLISSPFPIRSR